MTASRARATSLDGSLPERRAHARQERLARAAGHEHAVAEPEARLVGGVEPVELVGQARALHRGLGGPGVGRLPS